MKKLIVLILMCFAIPFAIPTAQAAINPATGIDYAVENTAFAIDVLSHKTRKVRLNAATEYWKKKWQPLCKTNIELFPLTTSESDGVITISCGEYELSQLELIEGSEFHTISLRNSSGDNFTDWEVVTPIQEFAMYWPQLLSKDASAAMKK